MKKSILLPKKKLSAQYLLRRPDLIKNISIISNKLNFATQSFYLAIHYLDIILSNTIVDLKIELIALCCIILAGILIMKKLNLTRRFQL